MNTEMTIDQLFSTKVDSSKEGTYSDYKLV